MSYKKWVPDRPRFIVDECEQCSDDRRFSDNTCVFNQNLGHAYSAEEIVEVLNNNGVFSDYLNELLQEKIWYCQAKFKLTGNEKYSIQEQCLKSLREECRDQSSIFKYSEFLIRYHNIE